LAKAEHRLSNGCRWDVDVLVTERRPVRNERRLLPWATADALLRPLFEDLAEPIGQLSRGSGLLGGNLEVQLRLLRPGTSVADFVAQQLLLATGAGFGLVTLLLASGQPVSTAVAIGLASSAIAFVLPRAKLASDDRQRRQRIQIELPQIVRLLAISRSAGLGLDASVERVARSSVGPLGHGLQQARAQVGAGLQLMDALAELAEREEVEELDDLVSRLRATDDHGLPLVQALEDLAESAEQRAVSRLLERGEKGALQALLPLGLLMVPVSVVVSVVPSILIMLGQASP
jgi:tight adherence protein C